ncbi:MAG: amidohydrolase [Desulfobacterales bacterium]|jgi:predicted amidohydrolase
MPDLKTTIIQTELVWEEIESNLAAFDDKINAIEDDTHLIVLPEMFTTGFSMKPADFAQDMNGPSVKWLREKSRQKNADIVGSIIVIDNGKYFNRLIWAKPQGEIFTYDKRHLFRMAGEEKVYNAGRQNITVELRGWKIRPFICYDLRFPVWTRNIENWYDAAIFIANWPERRSGHWKLLLQARAVENQCYVIGVNRVGIDGNGHRYSGDSSIIDPLGNIIFHNKNATITYTVDLSYETLKNARKSFPVWKDADTDLIRFK